MEEVYEANLVAYQNQKYEQFKQENIRQPKGAIVFVGDSLIEFYPLKKYLSATNPLINRGVCATGVAWLKEHLPQQVLALEPSQVIVLIGTNDIARGESQESIYANLVDVLASLQEHLLGVSIQLLSLLPVNEEERFSQTVHPRRNAMISSLNRLLSALPNVEFVDVYDSLLDKHGNLRSEYTIDGLHLSPLGYQKLSEKLQVYL